LNDAIFCRWLVRRTCFPPHVLEAMCFPYLVRQTHNSKYNGSIPESNILNTTNQKHSYCPWPVTDHRHLHCYAQKPKSYGQPRTLSQIYTVNWIFCPTWIFKHDSIKIEWQLKDFWIREANLLYLQEPKNHVCLIFYDYFKWRSKGQADKDLEVWISCRFASSTVRIPLTAWIHNRCTCV
jgi:hypothetical protein